MYIHKVIDIRINKAHLNRKPKPIRISLCLQKERHHMNAERSKLWKYLH